MASDQQQFWKDLGFKAMTVYITSDDSTTYYGCKVAAGRELMRMAKDQATPEWALLKLANRRAIGMPNEGEFAAIIANTKHRGAKKLLTEAMELAAEAKKSAYIAMNHAETEREMYELGAFSYACNFTADALYKQAKEMKK